MELAYPIHQSVKLIESDIYVPKYKHIYKSLQGKKQLGSMNEQQLSDIKQVKQLLIKLFYTEYIATDILNNCDFRLSELEKHKEWFNELVRSDLKSYEEIIHKESCYWSDETWNDWYNFVTK